MAKAQKAYDGGEMTIMSLNNMKMRLNALENETRLAKTDRNAALSQLAIQGKVKAAKASAKPPVSP